MSIKYYWSSQLENFLMIVVREGGNQGGSNPNAMFNVFQFPTLNVPAKERIVQLERAYVC
jgi:hypothetical protein